MYYTGFAQGDIVFAPCNHFKPYPGIITKIYRDTTCNISFIGYRSSARVFLDTLEFFNQQTVKKYEKLYFKTTDSQQKAILRTIKKAILLYVKKSKEQMKSLQLADPEIYNEHLLDQQKIKKQQKKQRIKLLNKNDVRIQLIKQRIVEGKKCNQRQQKSKAKQTRAEALPLVKKRNSGKEQKLQYLNISKQKIIIPKQQGRILCQSKFQQKLPEQRPVSQIYARKLQKKLNNKRLAKNNKSYQSQDQQQQYKTHKNISLSQSKDLSLKKIKIAQILKKKNQKNQFITVQSSLKLQKQQKQQQKQSQQQKQQNYQKHQKLQKVQNKQKYQKEEKRGNFFLKEWSKIQQNQKQLSKSINKSGIAKPKESEKREDIKHKKPQKDKKLKKVIKKLKIKGNKTNNTGKQGIIQKQTFQVKQQEQEQYYGINLQYKDQGPIIINKIYQTTSNVKVQTITKIQMGPSIPLEGQILVKKEHVGQHQMAKGQAKKKIIKKKKNKKKDSKRKRQKRRNMNKKVGNYLKIEDHDVKRQYDQMNVVQLGKDVVKKQQEISSYNIEHGYECNQQYLSFNDIEVDSFRPQKSLRSRSQHLQEDSEDSFMRIGKELNVAYYYDFQDLDCSYDQLSIQEDNYSKLFTTIPYRISMLQTNKTSQIIERFIKNINILTNYLKQKNGKKIKRKCPLSMKQKQILLTTLQCRKMTQKHLAQHQIIFKIFQFIIAYESCPFESLKTKCKMQYIKFRSFMNIQCLKFQRWSELQREQKKDFQIYEDMFSFYTQRGLK